VAILTPIVPDAEAAKLRMLQGHQQLDPSQSFQLDSAWIHAVFGDLPKLKAALKAAESDPGRFALGDDLERQVRAVQRGAAFNGQRAFLTLCELSCRLLPVTHPMHCDTVEKRIEWKLAREAAKQNWEFVESRCHEPYSLALLQKMLVACGFRDMFDRAPQRLDPGEDRAKVEAVAHLLREWKTRKSSARLGRSPSLKTVVASLSQTLSQELGIRVSSRGAASAQRSGYVYSIQGAKGTELWPEPTYDQYERYCTFVRSKTHGVQA
jgi:hypothetical protein